MKVLAIQSRPSSLYGMDYWLRWRPCLVSLPTIYAGSIGLRVSGGSSGRERGMIPGKPHIILEAVRPMLIQYHAGCCTSYKFPELETLDDDCIGILNPEYNHDLLDQLIVERWIHVDPLLPNPELEKELLITVEIIINR